jgi:hypothetical protein
MVEKRQFDLSALLSGGGAGGLGSLGSLFGSAGTGAAAGAGGFDLSSLGSLLGGGGGGKADLGSIASMFGSGSSSGGLLDILGNIGGLKDMATKAINSAMKAITLRAESVQVTQGELKDNAKRVKLKYGPFKIKGRNSTVSQAVAISD